MSDGAISGGRGTFPASLSAERRTARSADVADDDDAYDTVAAAGDGGPQHVGTNDYLSDRYSATLAEANRIALAVHEAEARRDARRRR